MKPAWVKHSFENLTEYLPQELMTCFKEKSTEQLMNTFPNFYEWKHLEQSQEPATAWSPR